MISHWWLQIPAGAFRLTKKLHRISEIFQLGYLENHHYKVLEGNMQEQVGKHGTGVHHSTLAHPSDEFLLSHFSILLHTKKNIFTGIHFQKRCVGFSTELTQAVVQNAVHVFAISPWKHV